MAIAGRVAIVPKGDWSAETEYKRLDEVTYNNTMFIAKKAVPKGTLPTNAEYWSKSIVGSAVTVDTDLSSTSTNPVQNKVIKAYVDKKASENVDFSTSTSKLLNDTVEAPLVLSKATRNLLNPTLQTTTIYGVTCTNNGDGTYTLNGTATSEVIFVFLQDKQGKSFYKNIVGKTLKFLNGGSINPPVGRFLFTLRDGNKWWSKGEQYDNNIFTVSEGYSQVTIDLHIYKDQTVTNVIIKPMLTTDLEATIDDFVPYSGYDIKSCGKNVVGNPSNLSSPTVKDGVITFPAKSAATNDTYLRLYSDVDISAFDTFRAVIESIGETFNDGSKSFVIIKTAGKKEFSTLSATNFESSANKYVSNVFNCSDFGNKIAEISVVIKRGYAYPGGSYKVSIFNGEDKEFSKWDSYVESSVHIDSTTEFPLLGLKSFNGVTNIISPGNVKVTYAKSEIGAVLLDALENKLDKDDIVNNQTTTEEGFALDARQANPNVKGSLGAQIKAINDMLNTKKIPSFAIENIFTGNPFCVVSGTTGLASFSGTKWEPDNGGYHVEDIKYPAGGQVNVTVNFTLTAHSIVIIDVNTLNSEKIEVQGSCISYNFTDSPKNDNISIRFAGRNENTTTSTIRYMPLVIHLA